MNERPKFDLERLPITFEGKAAGALARTVYAMAYAVHRAMVPGGWLVVVSGNSGASGVAFYPDPKHEWNGGTLD
jgi:hypothetical protein